MTAGKAVAGQVNKARIGEFCTGHNSLISQACPNHCEVIRFTIDDDMAAPSGLQRARDSVHAAGLKTLLWAAIPCDRSHSHVRVMSQDTKPTEGYTVQIADAVHDAWAAELQGKVEHLKQIQATNS